MQIRKVISWFLVSVIMTIAVMLLFVRADQNTNKVVDQIDQSIYGITLAGEYSFAGEKIPIDNFDVRERLERELLINTYQHSSTLLYLKLMARYLPYIERILQEQSLPDDLKYLAIAESSLRNAVSSAGAKGFWQFLSGTAKEYGLEVNEFVDERNHFEKSTLAACKYLKQLNQRFGSWSLAAAAYNMGPTALQTALDEQKENTYYGLNLSDETNRYLFRLVAIKSILKEPEKFGFYLKSDEDYEPMENYNTIAVNTSIPSLADFAHENGVSYRMLKLYNPWLMKGSLPNKTSKVYDLKIPR